MYNEKFNKAILLAKEADQKMMDYDYDEAKKLYSDAGNLFIELSVELEGVYQQNSARYSAAILHFKSGNYKLCLTIIGSIKIPYHREFKEEISELAIAAKVCQKDPKMILHTIADLEKKMASKRTVQYNGRKILDLLKDNPFAFTPLEATEIRYRTLIKMEKSDAALFAKDIIKLQPKSITNI